MGSELIGLHIFDNRYNDNTYNNDGYHTWGGSSIETFLNTNFYDAFSDQLKINVIDTEVKYGSALTVDGQPSYSYATTNNKVFLPSVDEMGGYYQYTGNLGTTYQFSVGTDFKLGNNLQAFMTRSPATAWGSIRIVMWHHIDRVWLDWANTTQFGILPVVNVKENTIVIPDGTGKYKISYNQSPTITVTSPGQNSYFGQAPNNKMTLSGTVSDTDNGDILKVYYRINGTQGQEGTQLGSNITANGNSQSFSNQITLPTLTDGNHTLYVWVEDDKSGKSTETAISFRVDKTNPTAPTINVNESWSKINVTATISHGTDGGSGVDRTEYSLSGATTLGWTTYLTGVTISNEGITTIKARTIDKVGNISSETSKSVKIDKTKPKINIIISSI